MALFSTLTADLRIELQLGPSDVELTGVAFDSRKVKQGFVFVAMSGTQVDGHHFIDNALELGALAIVCEKLPNERKEGILYAVVEDSSKALGFIASAWYGHPSRKLALVGCTGTNGKTSVVSMLFTLFRRLGYQAGMLSTVVNRIDDEQIAATHTTPDPLAINALLRKMVDRQVPFCFMEVSSHSVVQQRIAGLHFKGGIFTNISRDHLDFHKTFDNYIAAKQGFFTLLPKDAFALTNLDDRRGMVMVQNSKASINTYALKTPSDFKGRLLSNSLEGIEMEIDGKLGAFPLKGSFNAYNILAVYGAAVLLGEDPEEAIVQLSGIASPPGRFESIPGPKRRMGIIDYAHTPDALYNVLETIQEIRTKNESLITVVGCGGNRDKGKRPEMGQIAAKLSDKLILTSDNPRDEDALEIIMEMQRGVEPSHFRKVTIEPDRKQAIALAVEQSKPNDIILIAGKGHEDYQEIKGERFHFSDRSILIEFFKQLPD